MNSYNYMYDVKGWLAVVFGINSASIVNRKGKAEHYFLFTM